jgi:hypothetical protein
VEEHRRERAEMHALVAMDINAQTHPLRACFKQCKRSNKLVHRAYSKHDYDLGVRWLKEAKGYDHFRTIFPLWRGKQIKRLPRLLVDRVLPAVGACRVA